MPMRFLSQFIAIATGFAQTQSLCLAVSMERPSGDTFALVFTKPKP
jgi:hypothetical protein